MKKFIKHYDNPNEEKINFGIMNKTYDDSIIDYIVESCKSLEVLQYIKFIGYKINNDESNIDYNFYIKSRKKKKGDDSKYLMLEDSRYGELILKFEIECKGARKKITKKILYPKPDENGYYLIKGKKYFLLYQLVDNSTYTTKNNLTLKSLMPVSLKRNIKTYYDIHENRYTAPSYVVFVFRKEVEVILFYFVKFGMKKTLEYFSVDRLINFVEKPTNEEKYIYFQISGKILMEVDKYFFLKHQYVKSICFMILNVLSNRINFNTLENKDYWIERIGGIFSTNIHNYYEKGLNTMIFFDRMLDETTKKILKIKNENKKSIYSIIRWMIQNFNELKKKDNMDLNNKRLRCNEFIASLLTKEFSAKLNRIISLGRVKVTIERIEEIFKFPGDILLTHLFRSGLLRYDDIVNDLDFWNFAKYTIRGPQSLGAKNQNNISARSRGIHPSYLGKVDISVVGSDPGINSIITPFCKTYGLYFSENSDPEKFKDDFDTELFNYRKEHESGIFVDSKDTSSNTEFVSSLYKDCSIITEADTGKDYIYLKYILPDDEDEESTPI